MKQYNALLMLKELAKNEFIKSHPSVPAHCLPSFSYSDNTANSLTKSVMDFLNMKGHFAARVNVTGTYSQKLGKYIKSGATSGMSDITAVVNSQHWSIEIKMKDSQSKDQKKVEERVKAAGGKYTVIHSFQEFHNFYISNTNN